MTTCWDSLFFWQLYLARTAGFKRRLVDGSVIDIVYPIARQSSNSNSLIHNIYRTFINSLARLARFASCIGNALSCPEKSRWFDHGNAIRNLLESDFLAIRSILIVGAKLITKRAWLVKIHRDRIFIYLQLYIDTSVQNRNVVLRFGDGTINFISCCSVKSEARKETWYVIFYNSLYYMCR